MALAVADPVIVRILQSRGRTASVLIGSHLKKLTGEKGIFTVPGLVLKGLISEGDLCFKATVIPQPHYSEPSRFIYEALWRECWCCMAVGVPHNNLTCICMQPRRYLVLGLAACPRKSNVSHKYQQLRVVVNEA